MLDKVYKRIYRTVVTEETIDFGSFRLTINTRDRGGLQYKNASYWADLICPIQQEIIEWFHPTIFLDIGANYGFTSLVHFSLNPSTSIIAVEPSPLLVPYLQRNFQQNGCNDFCLIKSICTDKETETCQFSLNPVSSQDNRVIGMKGWQSVTTPSTTMSSLLKSSNENDFIYIKIDTQGFEEKVFAGGEKFLLSRGNWIIKTEFAPKWLISQGTNPAKLLEYLVENYWVVELPKRTRFKGDSIEILAQHLLEKQECSDFVNYIQSLAKGDGWCDLLVLPREPSYLLDN